MSGEWVEPTLVLLKECEETGRSSLRGGAGRQGCRPARTSSGPPVDDLDVARSPAIRRTLHRHSADH